MHPDACMSGGGIPFSQRTSCPMCPRATSVEICMAMASRSSFTQATQPVRATAASTTTSLTRAGHPFRRRLTMPASTNCRVWKTRPAKCYRAGSGIKSSRHCRNCLQYPSTRPRPAVPITTVADTKSGKSSRSTVHCASSMRPRAISGACFTAHLHLAPVSLGAIGPGHGLDH